MWSRFLPVMVRAEALEAQEEAMASILIPPTKPYLSMWETPVNKPEPQEPQQQSDGLREDLKK